MNVHADVLEATQRRALEAISPIAAERDFYLAGGTAVALHLGHRRSVDLDWFANRLDDPMRLAQALRDAGLAFETGQVEPGTLHGHAGDVAASFLGYRYPLLSPLQRWPEVGCSLASLDDLACMKLSAIAQRGAKKDFLDLYVLLEHRSLKELIRLYQQKFDTGDVAHLLYALSYFDDADRQPTPVLLRELDWPTVKRSIRAEVEEFAG